MMSVWKEVTNEEAFVKVFDRLKKNYLIIQKSGGGNDLVEDFRGKKGMEKIATYDFVAAVGEDAQEVGLEDDGDDVGNSNVEMGNAIIGDAINVEVDDDDGVEAEM